ncbi:uncharacterized protein LOC117782568 isoform X2 [Drosophila innubila]|uniref:uncharacterized protein LOC117782568 isoform X2 n=1 Tax=Drosophila innubila TaxID=198719 RepID=UPI00148C047E|nr:uncharacterized protein LOC117782568 isoform X2 [Drosophila innubila]
MGKHRTHQQDAIIVKFMKENVDIARGFSRSDRVEIAAAWKELTDELNANGPPCKSMEEWKRIWKDWKQAIKKKFTNITRQQLSADGETYKQEALTPTENALADVLQLEQAVNRVADAKAFGLSTDSFFAEYFEDIDDDEEGNINFESSEQKLDRSDLHTENPLETESEPDVSTGSSDCSMKTSPAQLSTLVAEENATLKLISNELRDLNTTAKSGVEAILAMGQQMCTLMQQQLEERQRHNAILEKLLEKQNK